MAQMTLQRAAQVFNRIRSETTFSTEPDENAFYQQRRRARAQKASFTLNINLSVDSHVVQQAEAYRSLALGKKDRMFQLMEIGTKIRSAMAEQQANCGVSRLVTQRVMVTQKIAILEHLVDAATDTLNPEMLREQADVIRQRLSSNAARETVARVQTSVLTAKDRDSLTAELTQLRSFLMGIDDELGTKNATNHIEVSSEDLRVLQAAGMAA